MANTAVLTALLLIAALLGWSRFEATWLSVTRSVISSPDVPVGFNGVRIVFVADLHAGDLLGGAYLERLVRRVESLDPDIIVLGGDYGGGGNGGETMFRAVMGRFRAKSGTVAVLGNHEWRWNNEEARAQLAGRDIVLLDNDSVRVRSASGDYIRIAGLDDHMTGKPDAERASRDIAADEFAVLVSHNPDALPAALEKTRGAFDLALSGHTHGGQLTVLGLWAPAVPSDYGQRFRSGWTEVEDVPVLVTRGVGSYQFAARMCARPEISVIELQSGPAGIRRIGNLRAKP